MKKTHEKYRVPVGRGELYEEIRTSLLASFTERAKPHLLYVCGQPGTGKTLTVRSVINDLIAEDPRRFRLAEVNALSLPTSNHIFLETCKRVLPEKSIPKTLRAAYTTLESTLKLSRQKPILLVIDEFDNIDCRNTARLTRIFDLFQWPRTYPTKFTLLCIANTVSLPDALVTRCRSRLAQMTVFPAYTWEGLRDIARSSLPASTVKKMDEDLINFCARKAAARNGDARLCLDLLKALDQEKVYTLKSASIRLKALFESEQAAFISCLQLSAKILIMCILLSIDKTSVSCFALSALDRFRTEVAAQNEQVVNSMFHAALSDLLGCRVVVLSAALQTEHVSLRSAPARSCRVQTEQIGNFRSHANVFLPWGQQQITLITPIADLVEGTRSVGGRSPMLSQIQEVYGEF